jgi:hypothetical protein
MPNWCYNYLTIEGNEQDIAKVKAQLNQPFTKMHDTFNMETGQMEFTETSYSNPVFAFHNIYNHTQAGISDEDYMKQPDHTLPIQEAMMFKGNHWYDFNVREWGTKWDVAVRDGEDYPETELNTEDDWSTSLTYRFNTAWSPPVPAIEKLSLQYPNLEFTLSYEEETGWGGEVLFVDGSGSEIESYENKCRDCDSVNTLQYCDNDCGEICDSCHYLGEADLECVAECDEHKIYLDDEHVPNYRMDQLNV